MKVPADKHILYLVHERDTAQILERLHLTEKIRQHQLRCCICGRIVSSDNIGVLFTRNDEIYVVCDNPLCLRNIHKCMSI